MWRARATAVLSVLLGGWPSVAAAQSHSIPDLAGWLTAFLTPIEIGSFRLSPARLVAALVLFAVLILLVRLLRRGLRAALLNPARMDASAAHSIDLAIGYLGLVLAAVAALSVAGIDVTNLAIVAGALSVGIGFGLQSIVNNFISGLIVLAERPVKVGDWIEIKGHRGRVSRISVRATRIETTEQASVFVPNAELIANPLVNLTPTGMRGTAVVRVGVPLGSDPMRVRAVLADALRESRLVEAEPAPSIAFDDIGPSALTFSVKATVAGPEVVGAAETELRSLIAPALARAGIGLAHPQTDVHLRDLDAVRAITLRILEERERKARMAAAEEPGPGSAPKG